MLRYVLSRLGQTLLVLICISLVSFVFMRLTGDPVGLVLPQDATMEQVATMRRQMGLDKALPLQYLQYLGHLLQGDLGRSMYSLEPVTGLILERMPATLELTVVAMLAALLIAVPIGVVSALYRGTLLDTASMLFALVGISMPHFWLGIMMVSLFSVHLGWLPTSGRGGWQHLILPAATLGLSLVALFARLVRSSMLEVLGQDYVRTARAKGASPLAVVGKHALRNALIPIVTVIGMQFGLLLGGTVIIETVFAWPGVGRLIVQAVMDRDYPVVQAAVMFLAAIFVLVNLLVDMLYVWIDPAISFRRGQA